MQNKLQYPRLFIRSKNDFAKHISRDSFVYSKSLALINDVLLNYDTYWRDSHRSQPEKGKYVRDASWSPLGNLLDLINKRVLAPHDRLLPCFIFGGVKGLNHLAAGVHLIGGKKQRTLLKLDITTFFEQISMERVYQFLRLKFSCSEIGANIVSKICCVPLGPKGSNSDKRTIGRGFATSSRLSIWCNLGTFMKLERVVQRRLKGRDPRVAIYVDDIGITASRTTKEEMEELYTELKQILLADQNQVLPLKDEKKKIISHEEGIKFLGLGIDRNGISIGPKTKSNFDRTKRKLMSTDLSPADRIRYRKRLKSLHTYKRSVDNK